MYVNCENFSTVCCDRVDRLIFPMGMAKAFTSECKLHCKPYCAC